jgi:hypothetical protein
MSREIPLASQEAQKEKPQVHPFSDLGKAEAFVLGIFKENPEISKVFIHYLSGGVAVREVLTRLELRNCQLSRENEEECSALEDRLRRCFNLAGESQSIGISFK